MRKETGMSKSAEASTEVPPNVVVDEPVLSVAPLIVRRIVKFGETDAAGIVYTGHFLDYALEAFEVWFRHVVGLTWQQQHRDMGAGQNAKKSRRGPGLFDVRLPGGRREVDQ